MFSAMCGRYLADLKSDDVAKLRDLSKQGPLPPWIVRWSINEPNKVVAQVHDRMPVILARDQVDSWLQTNDVREAAAMLKPAEDVLVRRPVSKRINSSKTAKDDPTLSDAKRETAKNGRIRTVGAQRALRRRGQCLPNLVA
jgi:putative SOS response-associated peptidase YedK